MPRGVVGDLGLRVRARGLRAEGLTYREIGECLGVPLKTVAGWCLDPDESKHRARVARYAGVCERCGGVTDGRNGPGKAPRVCLGCLEWSEEMIIGAMQDWALAHGGVPPKTLDWRLAAAGHPSADTCRGKGGWNNLLLKAGFRLRVDRRPETQAEIERLLGEGLSVNEVARRFGWSPRRVQARLSSRGLRVSDFRKVA